MPRTELAPRVTQQQQVLEVDLMFIKKIPFLVGVLHPLGLTVVQYLKDKTAPTLASGIKYFLSVALRRNFDVLETMRAVLHHCKRKSTGVE